MIQYQILRSNIRKIVYMIVRRITNEIFGVKGLKGDNKSLKVHELITILSLLFSVKQMFARKSKVMARKVEENGRQTERCGGNQTTGIISHNPPDISTFGYQLIFIL